ncbi:MAG: NADH:flavin oxidoreductase [Thermoguttaceae bacterium]|jgi:2,4-dienoyl-CoA reductase-like NADH-dependent reductase (Old Yellow Enzyme family)|nr:NADH:flavin oxidoreductase [Thermoguttaceae bacterium]
MPEYPHLTRFPSVAEFRQHVQRLGWDLPLDERALSADEGSPMAQPMDVGGFRVGNRWCIHPMEGWDGTEDGRPTAHTIRRWQHFGQSGAKLIWGGEAFAVRRDGRANPNQLYYRPENVHAMRDLLGALLDAHREKFGPGATDDLLVGLQLTHSGRFCRPNRKDRGEPRIAYHHPVLDAKFGIRPDDDSVVFRDDEIRRLVDDFVTVAKVAQEIGFGFVDVKQCHGYLGHEFLSAYDRPGPYGGDFEGRTRFLREILEGIRAECPGLLVGVRLSAFDTPPFYPDPRATGGGKFGPGIPHDYPTPYPGFGCRRDNPMQIDLEEPIRLLRMLRDEYRVALVNLTAGSPYYNPHIQRPAYYPPCDGYQPPEDPLAGCLRQIDVVRRLKQAVPGLPMVGTAYTYLQEFLPHAAQGVVREGWADFVGIGRLVLSYWDLPADVLAGRPLRTRRLCRTFSDCTTGPRNGLVSGCYPLDDYYKRSPEAEQLKQAKAAVRDRLR